MLQYQLLIQADSRPEIRRRGIFRRRTFFSSVSPRVNVTVSHTDGTNETHATYPITLGRLTNMELYYPDGELIRVIYPAVEEEMSLFKHFLPVV